MRLLNYQANPSSSRPFALFQPPATQVYTPGVPNDLMQWARKIVEKIRTSNVKWVPWIDDLTEETPTHRSHYRPMLREPVIKAAFKKKVLAVAALDVQVHPAEPDNPRHKDAAEFCLFAFSRVAGQTRKVAWNTLGSAIIDGCSVCEPVWDEPVRLGKWAGKRIWKAYKAKPLENVKLHTDDYKNILSVEGTINNQSQRYDPKGFVIWTHDQFFENIQGISDFRAAYRDFWLKQQSIEFRSLYLERFGLPWFVGTYTSRDQKAALEVALEEARGGTWLTVPPGVTATAVELATRGTADYQAAIDNCDRNMLIAINGSYLQVLEGQVADGRGDTSIHKETSELQEWMLAAEMGDVASKQLVPPLYAVNYPDVAPPIVTWGAIDEASIAAWLNNNLLIQQLGGNISSKQVYNYTGRQEPSDEADTLQPPALAAAPPMPFGEEPPAEKYQKEAEKRILAALEGKV